MFRRSGKGGSTMLNNTDVGSLISRRSFICASAAGVVMATGGGVLGRQPTTAPPAPRVNGPAVWLEMEQGALDAAYDQSVWAPNWQPIVRRWATNSEAVRALGRAAALRLWRHPDRRARCLRHQTPQRSDQRLHPWWRVAH